ncbi:MAG: RNA-binding transcriptional accessory protein, partial [Deltaproteobacteria bacterium]|nr:RNA-binding transcriptional accessory protein [Deltaproteobacteria bacterium]
MTTHHITKIADELKLRENQVHAAVGLLDDDATVPFIARYRKEMTGGLDELHIIDIRERLELLRALDKRRGSILKSLEEQGNLTEELESKVLAAETLAVLEDIYLPYRPKRRTRGLIAKEKGLEPLAREIFCQNDGDPVEAAALYIDPEKGVATHEDALAGARDIIAEWINEDADAREELRELFAARAVLRSKVVKEQEEKGIKYRDYYEWEERAATAPSHRILAIRRGADEGYLVFHILPDDEEGIGLLESRFVKNDTAASEQVRIAVRDSYRRLLSSSMETEIRLGCKKRADEEAIKVFAENLRELLLSPPLGGKSVLAIDPGFRTGCKVVCLDRQGKLLENETIYPVEPHNRRKEATEVLKRLVETHHIEAIAVGNGTGGRETEAFCKSFDFAGPVPVIMVNESGASVYSASEVAREEFPDCDVTVRGAVSIGRRLMDPLAELVKIDPKSIGVGQYQHDVDQKALKTALDDVVMSAVNAVGVEVNT